VLRPKVLRVGDFTARRIGESRASCEAESHAKEV
jgi:hypothetical protein